MFSRARSTAIPRADGRELVVEESRPFKGGGWIVAFDGIADRNEAELWRERYLLAPVSELDAGRAKARSTCTTCSGCPSCAPARSEPIGEVTDVYELPQGIMLDVRRPTGSVLIPFRPEVVTRVDLAARRLDHRPARGVDRVRIDIVTIFPEFFAAPLALSIPARAAAAGAVTYNVVDLRDFTHDRHRTVDDYPYGGGAGMVMKPEPFFEAVESLQVAGPIVLLSPRGRRFSMPTPCDSRRARRSRSSAVTTRTSISASPIFSRPRRSRSATSC